MFVHQPGGTFDLTGTRGTVRTGPRRGRPSARHLHRDGPRAGADHGRVCPLDRPSRDAAALVARLPAVASDAGQPRGGALDRAERSARRSCRATRSSIWGPASARRAGTPAMARSHSIPRPSPTPRRCSTSCTRCISTSCRTSSSALESVSGPCQRSASSQGRTDEVAGRQLLERPSRRLRPGRRRLVARRGRPARRRLAAGANPDVLGGCQTRPARSPPLCPPSQRLRRHAALRGVPLVGRRLLDLGDLARPTCRSRSTRA